MDVAGYVRVSTQQQKEEGSHERQREQLREWADREGHYLELYEDIAISGQSDDREAYDRLIDEAEQYDAVAVRELSRFGRNLQRIINDMADLKERDVDFLTLNGDFDTTTARGQLIFNIQASLNQYWADLARERAIENVERRREEGKPIGRPKKLDEEQIDKVMEWSDTGLGYSTIARLAKTEWDVDLHRSTVKRYVDEREAESASAEG